MSEGPHYRSDKADWSAHLSDVREEFDARAKSYGDYFEDSNKTGAAVLFRLRAKMAASMIAPSTGRLFDCACGSAEITEAIVQSTAFQEVWANDISREMLERAQQRLAPQQGKCSFFWLNSDIFMLNRDDLRDRFDTILCLGLLAHSGRLNELLATFKPMLRTNGSIILQSSLLNHPGSRLIKLVTDRRHAAGTKYKFSFYTFEQIVNAAREAGLVVEEVRRFGICIPFGDRLLGKANYWLERTFAASMRSFGGEALFRFRKTGQ